MKKLIVALIFACLLSLTSLSGVSISANSEEEIRVTKTLWNTSINGTAFSSETIPDMDNDGHEDLLVASRVYNDSVVIGGYLTFIDGRNGTTIRKISLDYAPEEVLCLPEEDCIVVGKTAGGADVYDMQFNLKFSIPIHHMWAHFYQYFGYFYGKWIWGQADFGNYEPNAWDHTEQEGYVTEAYLDFMVGAAEQPEPDTWTPYPYLLDVKTDGNYTGGPLTGTPPRFEYETKWLNTFDGTDLVYPEGYYYDVANNTHIGSYSLTNGSFNWRTGGLSAPLTRVDTVEGLEFLPGGGTGPDEAGTWIFAPIYGVVEFKVVNTTRAVAILRTIGTPGLNFTNHSSKGEWPLILLDQNGAHVEQIKLTNEVGFGAGFYATGVENATYEEHTVSPITLYDETSFLVTVTGLETSVIVCYSIVHDNFTILWKKPVDRGNLNRGFLIEDLNNDGEEEIIAVIDGNVTVLDGTDGSKIYGTDLSTFVIVDVAHLSLGDVILTNEGNGYLLTFGGSNHTTYWKPYFGSAWETFISSMQDVDGDDRTDLVVAVGDNVTCHWGYYEIYTPPPTPIQEEWWFWTIIAVVADVIVIGLVAFWRRRTLARETATTI